MEWSWPERVLSNRERVMEELIQGRELASQLRRGLDDKSVVSGGRDGVGSAEGIVNKILGSFANTLFILNGKESDDSYHKELISDQIQGNSGGGASESSSWDGHHHEGQHAIKSEDSQEESCKSASTFKDRRGSYKRRKTSHSWTRDTPALTDDGHAWRKYGQKVILNAQHPRNYFRCTHKFDQACQATKHVQKVQDDPPVFRTTYYGTHTCRDYLKASELVLLDCSSPRDSSKFISFEQTNLASKQEHLFFSSFTSSVKKEVTNKEEIPSHDHHVMTHSSSCDYLALPDLTAFESSGPLSGFSSTIDYDHDDVISGMLVGSYNNFDDEKFCNLNFDF